jgi:cellulose synthase (UDP-forming)
LIITPLKVWQQGVVAVLLMVVGQIVVRVEYQQSDQKTSEYLHLFLVWLSIVTTLRYLYYRTSYTLNFNSLDQRAILCAVVRGGTVCNLDARTCLLSNPQNQDREPVDLSNFPQDQWFKVDIYIPTYNEDVEIVRKTVLAADSDRLSSRQKTSLCLG